MNRQWVFGIVGVVAFFGILLFSMRTTPQQRELEHQSALSVDLMACERHVFEMTKKIAECGSVSVNINDEAKRKEREMDAALSSALQQLHQLQQQQPQPQSPSCPSPSSSSSPTTTTPPASVSKKEYRVISMGLYGADSRYTNGIIRNAQLVPSVFPGWRLRVYHDSTVPADVLRRLKEMGSELINMDSGEKGNIAGMFWRFYVADDPNVDRYIIRDCDALLTGRDYMSVQAWIESGKGFHIVRDHPSHSNYVMSGGLWGGTKNSFIKLRERASKWSNKNDYVQDMHFLGNIIYPLIKDDVIAHDAFSCSDCNPCPYHGKYENSYPFPTPRAEYEHLGARFHGNGSPYQEDIDILKRSPPPSQCTPKWPFAS
eukprot:TRINITY_DN4210_c0_g1_i1.p1 TRINITY_DN4210_c0_g1~~TRINITY_DN4210_c0_g1_i1.p1  ORF type:complete len:372 (+),score=77.21 TRINITY_DN4210_c0_g1_i1:88-1203(+)